MPELGGLDVVRRLSPTALPLVAFVTAVEDFSIEAVELNAIDYLLKPVELDSLQATIDRARGRLEHLEPARQRAEALAEAASAYARAGRGGGGDQAMNDFNVIGVAVNAEVEARVRPVMARYEQQLASQRAMVGRLRILSPAILMQEALNDVSGTGASRHQHFLRQVGEYHDTWRAYFVPLIFRKAQIQRYDTLPAFAFDDESLAMMASRVVANVGLMLVSATLLGGAAWWRLRRMSTV